MTLALTTPLLARPALERTGGRDDANEAQNEEQTPETEAAREYALALQDHQRTGVDTSLADALTEVPLLDVYNPDSFAPLGEMPRLPFRGYYLVAPGQYELDGAVFCLHAGAYAPGGGDGYALAPLKGLGADLIYTVLYRWTGSPEISQHSIQLMLWGIVDRVSPDNLSEDLTAEIADLLSPEEIETWRRLARPVDPPAVPEDLDQEILERVAAEMGITVPVTPDQLRSRIDSLNARRAAAGMLPGGVGRIVGQIEDLQRQLERLEAMADQPGGLFAGVAGPLLQQAGVPYEEIEAVAAPFGDPEPPEGSREIPLCRWSYEPYGGLFVRHIPIEGYWRALVQVSAPGRCALERDAAGRLVSVTGATGDRVEVEYAGDAEAVGDHEGLASARVSAVRYVPVAGDPTAWSGESVVLIGQPEEEGGAKDKAVAERIESARALRTQVLGIAKATIDAGGRRPTKNLPDWEGPADVLDLVSLVEAYPAVVDYEPVTSPLEARDTPPTGPEAAALEVLCEAVQAAVRDEVDAIVGLRRMSTTVTWRAPGALGCVAFADYDPDDWGPKNPFDPANRKKGPQLPQFDPSGDVAQPGNTGRQRLATAAKGSEASEEGAGEGDGTGVGDSPGSWFGGWLDSLLDVFRTIDDWLSNDPPREDYKSLDLPATPALPAPERPEGFSDARWEAAQALLAAVLACDADGWKAKICLDRMGGAARADRDDWVWTQACALTHHKRQVGVDMLLLADAVDAYREVLLAEGEDDSPLPAGEASPDLAQIRQQAAELLGIPVEELASAHAARSEAGVGIGRVQALSEFAKGLRATGEVWSRLPDVPMPTDVAGVAVAVTVE